MLSSSINTDRKDQKWIDPEPRVEVFNTFCKLFQRHNRLLYNMRAGGRPPDHGSPEKLEKANLRRSHPTPETTINGMVGKWNHQFKLPENTSGESMVEVFDRNNLPIFTSLQESFDVPKVKRLPEMVDSI
mmetsp:Transcript_69056/g.191242  ORF Transcript_69056/g.191242 Transcript_69056/m.191242 type:complete len:130 (+) Transcript_69056:515-904(+)